MQHNDLHNDFTELIAKYLSGNADDAEVRRLEDWVLTSAENKRQFQQSKKAWQLSRLTSQTTDNQSDTAWKSVSEKLFNEPKVVKIQPRNNRRIFMRIAAAAVVLLGIGIWAFFNQSEKPMVATTTDKSENIDLPDGTKVVLNQASLLNYSPALDKNQRVVTLEGDAFFDVKKDKSRPFVIAAGEVEIEVLGTAFYVDSRSESDEIQVVVEHGSVAVRSGGMEEILKAGDKAVFQKQDKKLSKKSNEDANFDFLKTNTLKFENAPMSEVVFALNRFYNFNISIKNEALDNCQLTANFKDKSLNSVVKIIEKTLGIHSKRTKTGIVFLGECQE